MDEKLYTVIGFDLAAHVGEVFEGVMAEHGAAAMVGVWKYAHAFGSDYQPIAAIVGHVEIAGFWQDLPEKYEPAPGPERGFTIFCFDTALEYAVIQPAHSTDWIGAAFQHLRLRQAAHTYFPVAVASGIVSIRPEDTWEALRQQPASSPTTHIGREYRQVMSRLAVTQAYPQITVNGRTYIQTPTGRLGPRVRQRGGWIKPGTRPKT